MARFNPVNWAVEPQPRGRFGDTDWRSCSRVSACSRRCSSCRRPRDARVPRLPALDLISAARTGGTRLHRETEILQRGRANGGSVRCRMSLATSSWFVEFFATLSTGDLEALRPLIHREGSWEVMATTVPGAGLTEGGDAVIDDFLKPVRGLFAPGDPKIEVKRTFSAGDLVCAETEADRRAEQRQPLPQPLCVGHRDQGRQGVPPARVHGHRVHHERGGLTWPMRRSSTSTCSASRPFATLERSTTACASCRRPSSSAARTSPSSGVTSTSRMAWLIGARSRRRRAPGTTPTRRVPRSC